MTLFDETTGSQYGTCNPCVLGPPVSTPIIMSSQLGVPLKLPILLKLAGD